jgi:hypothetical protein
MVESRASHRTALLLRPNPRHPNMTTPWTAATRPSSPSSWIFPKKSCCNSPSHSGHVSGQSSRVPTLAFRRAISKQSIVWPAVSTARSPDFPRPLTLTDLYLFPRTSVLLRPKKEVFTTTSASCPVAGAPCACHAFRDQVERADDPELATCTMGKVEALRQWSRRPHHPGQTQRSQGSRGMLGVSLRVTTPLLLPEDMALHMEPDDVTSGISVARGRREIGGCDGFLACKTGLPNVPTDGAHQKRVKPRL